jgi:hypothetical protein
LYNNIGGVSNLFDRDGNINAFDIDNVPDSMATDSTKTVIDWQGIVDKNGSISKAVADEISGTKSWEKVLADGGVIPLDKTTAKTISDTAITDVNVADVTIPEEVSKYRVTLVDLFPFCLPFDFIDFVKVMKADPIAPNFDWTFKFPSKFGLKDYKLHIDLSPWDLVASIFRRMELLAFVIGLILITRSKMIRG